jgi:hypothetical protein
MVDLIQYLFMRLLGVTSHCNDSLKAHVSVPQIINHLFVLLQPPQVV